MILYKLFKTDTLHQNFNAIQLNILQKFKIFIIYILESL
jgi:hypothetical protein